MTKRNNLIGEVFGYLTVINGEPRKRKSSNRIEMIWECQCDCGNVILAAATALRKGKTKSCGCYLKKWTKERFTAHGASGNGKRTHEYQAWINMRVRCTNQKKDTAPYYSIRGITYSPEWIDFAVFLNDIGYAPSRKHTLDRIDNSLGYSKDNCKWSTPKEQSRNTRKNVVYRFHGRDMCVAEIAEVTGIRYGKLYYAHRTGKLDNYLLTIGG